MNRRERRRARSIAAKSTQAVRACRAREGQTTLVRLGCADRKTLLLGTALASMVLLGIVVGPTPAQAVATCDLNPPDVPASPGPISLDQMQPIHCINTEPRINATGDAIFLNTSGGSYNIYLNNSGELTATNAGGDANGIVAYTKSNGALIDIINSGDIEATSTTGQRLWHQHVPGRTERPHHHHQ